MKEQHLKPQEKIDRLNLEQLRMGDVVTITTGLDDEAWRYIFILDEASQWPHGTIKGISPDGAETEELGFSLHGAGQWTDRRQNPVQKQDRGFTSYYDSIYLDGFMVGQFDGHDERQVFGQPGQQITHIDLKRQN